MPLWFVNPRRKKRGSKKRQSYGAMHRTRKRRLYKRNPSQVASSAYRSGWEGAFGKSKARKPKRKGSKRGSRAARMHTIAVAQAKRLRGSKAKPRKRSRKEKERLRKVAKRHKKRRGGPGRGYKWVKTPHGIFREKVRKSRKKKKGKSSMAKKKRKRKSPKRVAAGKKAARTKKRKKAARAKAAKKTRRRKKRRGVSRKRRSGGRKVAARKRKGRKRGRRMSKRRSRRRGRPRGIKGGYAKAHRRIRKRYGRGVRGLAKARRAIKYQRKYGGGPAKRFVKRFRMRTNPGEGIKALAKSLVPITVGFFGARAVAANVGRVPVVGGLLDRLGMHSGVAKAVVGGAAIWGVCRVLGKKVDMLAKACDNLMIGAGVNVALTAISTYVPANIKALIGAGDVYDEALAAGEYLNTGEYLSTGEYEEMAATEELAAMEETAGWADGLTKLVPGFSRYKALPSHPAVSEVPDFADRADEDLYSGVFANKNSGWNF